MLVGCFHLYSCLHTDSSTQCGMIWERRVLQELNSRHPEFEKVHSATQSVLVVHTTVTLISWNPARFPPNLFSTGMILTGMFSSDIRTKHDTFYDILTINCYWFSKIRNYLLGKIYCLECVFTVIMPMQNRFGAKRASAKHASGRMTPLTISCTLQGHQRKTRHFINWKMRKIRLSTILWKDLQEITTDRKWKTGRVQRYCYHHWET